MRKTRIVPPQTPSPERRPSFCTRAALAALAGAAIVASAPGALAQETLRWKLKPGDVLKYTTEQKMVMSVKGSMVRERKQTRTQTIQYTWTVNEVADDGLAEILQRIDRVSMRVDAPPFMPFEFDSTKPNAEVDEPFEAEARQLKATIGAEFTFKMKPSGEIADIKIAEPTLKKLKDALPAEEPAQAGFSEQSLKDMLLQSSPPPFPQIALEPGKTWSAKPTKLSLPVGSLVMEKIFTCQGPDPKNPRLILIGMEGRVTLEPGENVSAKIKAQEGKGSLAFDAQAGRIVNSRSVQRTEMVMSAAGQDIDQTTEMTSTMILAP